MAKGSDSIRRLAIDMDRLRKRTPAAARSAVNAAATAARRQAVNDIYDKLNLSKARIRERTSVNRARQGETVSSVVIGGSEIIKGRTRERKGFRLEAIEFATAGIRKGTRKQAKRGLRLRIARGGGSKLIGPLAGKTTGLAFVSKFKSGKLAVVGRYEQSATSEGRDRRKRLRRGRLPVLLLRGPSVEGVFEKNPDFTLRAFRSGQSEVVERLLPLAAKELT